MNEYDPNVPRRGVLCFAAVSMVLFTVGMYFFIGQAGWRPAMVGFEGVCGMISFALVLALINTQKYWWALRVVTFVIFAAFLWYLIDECYIKHETMHIGDLGAESLSEVFFSSAFLAYFTRCGVAFGARRVNAK